MILKAKTKKIISQTVLNLIIAFLLFIMLYPLAMALWNSFKTANEYEMTKWYPTLPMKIENIASGVSLTKNYIFNTLFVAVVGIFGQMFISSLASYAFAKTKFPGKTFFFYLVIVLMMVPGVMTIVPQSILYNSLHLYDSLFSLILPMWTGGCVGTVFLLNIFFHGIPNDIFESAEIDGAGMFRCYVVIAIPLSAAIICTLCIMSVISVWNDYMWPSIMLTNEKFTISAGLLNAFNTEYSADMPVMFATYLVASLPLIFLFVFANKFYIQGLMSTSIKR